MVFSLFTKKQPDSQGSEPQQGASPQVLDLNKKPVDLAAESLNPSGNRGTRGNIADPTVSIDKNLSAAINRAEQSNINRAENPSNATALRTQIKDQMNLIAQIGNNPDAVYERTTMRAVQQVRMGGVPDSVLSRLQNFKSPIPREENRATLT